MSALKEFLASLPSLGIEIYLDQGKLKTRSPPEAITHDVAARIRENKDQLIALLGEPAARRLPGPVAANEGAPLSFSQQRLWFLSQFEGGSESYNIPLALRLRGALNVVALQAALNEIVRRHEILRTTYHKSPAGCVQIVAAPRPVLIAMEDLSGLEEPERFAGVRRIGDRESTSAFDLEKDLMMRVRLAKEATDCHLLFVTLHHIAADGWSLGVLLREMVALYEAHVSGRDVHLPALEMQYRDFAAWQRQTQSEQALRPHLDFFKELLRDAPQWVSMPADRTRPIQQRFTGKLQRHDIPLQLLSALKSVAHRQGVSLFMLLQAALALLVGRWSVQRDVVMGTPVAGRSLLRTEPLIGCFINTIALRTRLEENATFAQLLSQTRKTVLDAFDHQEVPFETVVEGLNPSRSLTHSPLLQLVFALQNYDIDSVELSGVTVEELVSDVQATKYDLVVMATETAKGLRTTWTYADSLFDPETVDAMAASFEVLLEAIALSVDVKVWEVPLLRNSERQARLDAARAGEQKACVVEDHGALLPQGAIGEVCLFDQPPDGLTKRTGELGRERKDGTIETLGRKDLTSVLNGARIATGQIEGFLNEVEGIDAAFVTVRSASSAGASMPTLVAWIVPETVPEEQDAASLSAAQETLIRRCRDHLKASLPEFMQPRILTMLDALPLDAEGRVAVAKLPEPDVRQLEKKEFVAPQRDIEVRLSEIWRTVLSLERVGIHDNFFEAGGTSLHCILVQQEIANTLGREIPVTDLFTYPTIADLAEHLSSSANQPAAAVLAAAEEGVPQDSGTDETYPPIAVIGMSGRFPGAADVDTFWKNIAAGKESWDACSDEDLRAAGVSEELLRNPNYVKLSMSLPGIQEFDAGLFGFTPREAEMMDPQQRVLFECALEALEQGGYADDARKKSVGVFVGVNESLYFLQHLLPQAAQLASMRPAIMYGNFKDYSATRLSYHLNLSGPSVTVSTACSTSLVAVHQACEALRNGECEMALAGGVSILQLSPQGYLHQEGGIGSPDGRCRPFDRGANGTRGGSGGGVVLLKRLKDAQAAGDPVLAVIRSTATNNDASDKVGYTAPSVFGQATVIRRAQRLAGVEPQTIQYVEAHGTGTPLGDPIEIRALTEAFGNSGPGNCAIGAVKGNIGHLDAGAGVAGLIKTVRVLRERQLPPSINFSEANPAIPFAQSPFYVNTTLRDWPAGSHPRRAAVSSFGIGGTNAHAVLEEAPESPASQPLREAQLIILSARSEASLGRLCSSLLEHLQGHPEENLADVAYTLQVGRALHAYRRAFVARSREEAIDILAGRLPDAWMTHHVVDDVPPAVVFRFSGDEEARYGSLAQELVSWAITPTNSVAADGPASGETTHGRNMVVVEFGPHTDLLKTLGALVLRGVRCDWRAFHAGERLRRVSLPTYPFERQRLWIDKPSTAAVTPESGRVAAPGQWFYVPVWKQAALAPHTGASEDRVCIVFNGCDEFSAPLTGQLRSAGVNAVVVRADERDYRGQLRSIGPGHANGIRVVSVSADFKSLLRLSRDLISQMPEVPVQLDVITRNVFSVTGDEPIDAGAAAVIGLCKVLPQEHSQFRTFHVDLGTYDSRAAGQVVSELLGKDRVNHAAWRGRQRWVLSHEPQQAGAGESQPQIEAGGTYLITGGLGRIGLRLAAHLVAKRAGALVLISRAPPESPPPQLRALQANGIPVWVRYADVADETQLRAVVDEMEQQFGALDGVIHCAGKVREAARPLLDLAPADIDEHFRGKVSGALALDRVLAGRDVGFCLLMSSLSSVLGGLGFAAYAAANAVLDGLVRDKRNAGDARWFAINWDGWFFEGPPDGFGMTAEEGMQAFDLALGMRHLPEIICSTGSLEARKRQWLNPAAKPAAPKLYARPEVQSEYVGPRTAMERELVEIWQELLGIEQVGVEDDFFELGGDSLLLVRLLNMMRSRVSAQEATIPLKSLFEYPTIAGIASVIAAHEESQRFASRSSQLRSSAQVAEVGEI